MIAEADFTLAKSIVASYPNLPYRSGEQFSQEYQDQDLFTTALKIIHKTVTDGTHDLSDLRSNIIEINTRLAHRDSLDKVLQPLYGFQVAVPSNVRTKITHTITFIPRAALAIVVDLVLVVASAIVILVVHSFKPDFNPKDHEIKKDKIPILLIHGSRSNEAQWILGRQFLKKEEYGSVFSLNLDGLASNDPTKGIDDYAQTVSEKIKEIKAKTGQNQVILIGHSMGGLVAGYYAQHLAPKGEIKHIMSVATPWQGTPFLARHFPDTKEKRYKQMLPDSLDRWLLTTHLLRSERRGDFKLYDIGSTMDFLVPASCSNLTEDPRRQRVFTYLGHYGSVIAPPVWWQIRSWLDAAYAEEASIPVTIRPDLSNPLCLSN